MNKIMNEKLDALKEFVTLCDTHKIWYSLDNLSLLSTVSEKDIEDKIDFHEVMMTYESYEEFKTKCTDFVIDNTKHSSYKTTQIKFAKDANNFLEEKAFVNINLLLPVKVKTLKKFLNFKNYERSRMQNLQTRYRSTSAQLEGKILSLFWPKLTYKEIINSLEDKEYEGYVTTRERINKKWKRNWITHVSFERKTIDFHGIKVKILSEFESYLTNIFGENFSDFEVEPLKNIHINLVDFVSVNTFNLAKQKEEQDKIKEEIIEHTISDPQVKVKSKEKLSKDSDKNIEE
ncbi:lipopolysaccharide cholinephosphotransferase [Metamycoplasma subdolum]|uniref:Lipopolysaccharide cholinephosphotransferase n=1 Tax=Metamycoplasma subdolum TaxID=92407 RepID=A0A3M0A2M3_9BACT|nr:LicD family protein [Metamycoplasma subdolum]RMA79070.1 lipopolysaccharide cholinephosphotransferase [Metamycoplasma subdolum]WPB50593.1 hypothetical protein R9C05_00305 [Metamycoplasma subdolum]